jgi:hypothetical protein
MEPNIILLGDSHAEHLFFGIAEKLERDNVAFYIKDGRPSLADDGFKSIFTELIAVSGVGKTVLISTYYRQDFAKYDLLNELKETVITLKGLGYTVILLGNVPSFASKPNACVSRKVFFRKTEGCYINIEDLNRQLELYDSFLRNLSKDIDVEYLSTNNKLLCDEGRCSMVKDNVLLYRDRSHLNVYGSRLIGADFASRLIDKNFLR